MFTHLAGGIPLHVLHFFHVLLLPGVIVLWQPTRMRPMTLQYHRVEVLVEQLMQQTLHTLAERQLGKLS